MLKLIIVLSLLILLSGCFANNTEQSISGNEQVAYISDISAITEDRATGSSQNIVMVSVSTERTVVVMEDGGLWEWDAWNSNPTWIMGNVIYAVAGETHALAITTDGALWAWGNNHAGQLGDGTTESRHEPIQIMENVAEAVIAPNFHSGQLDYLSWRSYAITENRELWAWGGAGSDSYDTLGGYLGDGSYENRLTPVRIMENVASFVPSYSGGFAITECGTLLGWGANYDGLFSDTAANLFEMNDDLNSISQLLPVPLMDDAAKVIVYHRGRVLAIATDGSLWALGNPHVKLMDNVSNAQGAYPYAMFVLTNDGDLYSWGQPNLLNSDNWRDNPRIPVLGDGTTDNRREPVRIMENVSSFSLAANSAYAITMDGGLWTWGTNLIWSYNEDTRQWQQNGQLRLSPERILDNVASVSSSFMCDHGTTTNRTFAVTNDGALWAWSNNEQGLAALGNGTNEPSLDPVRIVIGA